MAFTRVYFAFLTCAGMVMVYHCEADCPPPPTGLSYKWLDPFTVNVSWQKPLRVQDGEVQYTYRLKNDADNSVVRTDWRNFTDSCLTEEMGSDHWTYHVWTVGSKSCESSNQSTPVSITVRTLKARAKVKDIKCLIYPKGMNCSWVPGNHSVKVSYRICGSSEEHIKGLKECDKPYSSGIRNGCHLNANAVKKEICMLVDTGDGLSTFKPALVIPPPKLSITEEGDTLKLNWKHPEFGSCFWIYEISYKQCNEPKVWRNFSTSQGDTMEVAYDKKCLYEFQSRVRTGDNCKKITSDFGEVVHYGTNKAPDKTLTVVAIVIPILLSVCIILSCYCFRRHSAIICPIIPDPSAIFKEMMMNGNKEVKMIGKVYSPVPEPIEPCEVTLINENSDLQQNS
ncbi:interleukin-13 receptor subunit alpha-1-like [Cottoperca gobio]|uniref:Interleukin-13 receptor subunit alpha-1-like n=1 Tax=Cottoperca gobio TaxID=56716 RepID=A0A6J2RMV6_COTGO|nr:interleukin-13 receptor subunit alpha-1-like [Cottoperca gobio]